MFKMCIKIEKSFKIVNLYQRIMTKKTREKCKTIKGNIQIMKVKGKF